MGCDIHTYVEQQDFDGKWERAEWPDTNRRTYVYGPFDWRSYGMFGFLGYEGRNYSHVPAIAESRDLPGDVSPSLRELADDPDWHSHSWLSVTELAKFDYTQTFEDRRVRVEVRPGVWDGAGLAVPGEGEVVSFKDFLGEGFFLDLGTLTAMNAVRPTRVVFWFDN